MIRFSCRFDFVVTVAVASTIPQLTHFSRSEAQHSSNPILVKKRAKLNIYNPFMTKKNKRCFSTDDELSNEKINILSFFTDVASLWKSFLMVVKYLFSLKHTAGQIRFAVSLRELLSG